MINEAVELAKSFGATDGHRFVNGVLDKFAADARAAEIAALRAELVSCSANSAGIHGTDHFRRMRQFLVRGALLAASLSGIRGGCRTRLVVYCSHDADACELAAQTFERETGIATSITRKATGEFYAQIRAERDNPKARRLVRRHHRSVPAGRCRRTVRRVPLAAARRARAVGAHGRPRSSDYKVAAIYRIVIGFGSNPALLAKKGSPRRAAGRTSPSPRTAKDIELSNPVTSGTGYTILATLVTLYGEDGAFEYLKRLAPNVVRYTQSGTAQGPSVARGEVGVGVSFVHEFVTQQLAGIRRRHRDSVRRHRRGAGRHGDRQRRAASGRGARVLRLGAHARRRRSSRTARSNLIIPANAAATIRPEAARFAQVETLDVDPLKFGAAGGAQAPARALAARNRRCVDDERIRADRRGTSGGR